MNIPLSIKISNLFIKRHKIVKSTNKEIWDEKKKLTKIKKRLDEIRDDLIFKMGELENISNVVTFKKNNLHKNENNYFVKKYIDWAFKIITMISYERDFKKIYIEWALDFIMKSF